MHDVDGVNAGYARLLLDEYLDNPEAVSPEWRALFESGRFRRSSATSPGSHGCSSSCPRTERQAERRARSAAVAHGGAADRRRPSRSQAEPAVGTTPDWQLLGGVAAAMALVKAHRMHGHLAAHLDPLGAEPIGDPALDPLRLEPKLTPELQARIPTALLRVHVEGDTLRRGAAAAEGDLLRLDGLRDGAHRGPRAARVAAQGDRVVAVPHPAPARGAAAASMRASARSRGWSATCAARSSGQKQFSLEGLDVLIPMLDEALEIAASAGVSRGRDRAWRTAGGSTSSRTRSACRTSRSSASSRASGRSRSSPPTSRAAPGDVKYHLGAEGIREHRRAARSR